MGFGLVLPSLLFVANNMGASPALATVIFAAFSLSQFIATPLWGKLSDRLGRKPVLAISMLGSGISYVAVGLAGDIWSLMAARAFGGLMAGNFSTAMAYVTDVTTPETRGKGMGVIGAGISLGFVLGPALGGFLGGATAETATLFLPGLVSGGIALLTFVAILLFLPESLPAEQRLKNREIHAETGGSSFKSIVTRPVLAQMLLATLLFVFTMDMFQTIYPLWSKTSFDFGPREVGMTFMGLGLLITFIQGVLIGPLTKRFGSHRLVVTSAVFYLAGLLVLAFSPTWQVMAGGMGLTAIGVAFFNTSMSSLFSLEARPHERGFVLGIYQSASWFARGVGPLASGAIYQTGANHPMLLGSLILVPVIGLMLSFGRRLHAPKPEDAATAGSSSQ